MLHHAHVALVQAPRSKGHVSACPLRAFLPIITLEFSNRSSVRLPETLHHMPSASPRRGKPRFPHETRRLFSPYGHSGYHTPPLSGLTNNVPAKTGDEDHVVRRRKITREGSMRLIRRREFSIPCVVDRPTNPFFLV